MVGTKTHLAVNSNLADKVIFLHDPINSSFFSLIEIVIKVNYQSVYYQYKRHYYKIHNKPNLKLNKQDIKLLPNRRFEYYESMSRQGRA